MSSILELPTVRQRVARISVESYHTMSELRLVEERTELLRGAIVEKMTKTPLHVSVVERLYELFRAAGRPRRVVRKEHPLTLADSEPEPDIAVVAGEPNDFRKSHPRSALLVAEVVVSSEAIDREKAGLYAEAGVAEFWLVLPERDTIEVFTLPAAGKYTKKRVVRRGEKLATKALPAFDVKPDAIFD
ncbi:MAG: hypothetical protein RLZZ15_3975 [Verrucomicrobiota bacterium]|jgi:Uma2 family endonuclease